MLSESEHRVEVLLSQLNDAVHELLRENSTLRRRLQHSTGVVQHHRSSSSVAASAAAMMPGASTAANTFPRSDNRLISLFKGNSKPRVQMWNSCRHLVGHRDGILDVSTCPFDADLLCTASADRSAIIWSTMSNSAVAVFKAHTGAVNSARFHPIKPLLLTASGDRTVSVSRFRHQLVRRGSEHSHRSSVEEKDLSLDRDFHNDSEQIDRGIAPSAARSQSWPAVASLLHNEESRIDDVDDNENELGADLGPSRLPMTTRARSSSFPSLSRARVVESSDLVCNAHSDVVTCADWIGNGDRFVSCSWDRQAIVWGVEEGSARVIRRLRGHDHRINHVSANPAGGIQVLTSSVDETFRLWDLRSPLHPVNAFCGHTGPVNSAEFIPASGIELVASSSDDRTVQIWDLRVMKKPLVEIGCSSRVNRLCVSPSGSVVTLPGDDGSLKSYNLNGDMLIRTPRDSYTGILTSAAWSLDENVLYSGGWDLNITSWKGSPDFESYERVEVANQFSS